VEEEAEERWKRGGEKWRIGGWVEVEEEVEEDMFLILTRAFFSPS